MFLSPAIPPLKISKNMFKKEKSLPVKTPFPPGSTPSLLLLCSASPSLGKEHSAGTWRPRVFTAGAVG